MSKEITATVVIPTYNGEQYLKEIFKSLKNQRQVENFEILVIDSGSTDKTISIITQAQKTNPAIVFHQIPNTEFGHGKTRNLAARMAKGNYVIYLTHDATPAHPLWLYEMIKPFELDQKIVAVMGKQTPRAHCIPLLKYEIRSVFHNLGPDFGTTLFYKDSFIKEQKQYDSVRFYSDANSAARRDFLVNTLPYRDVAYAEDQAFGQDIIEAGYIKAYSPRGRVLHSNDLKLSEYSSRMVDEVIALRKTGAGVSRASLPLIIRLIVRKTIGDTLRIVRDDEYSWKRKLYWLVLNPLFVIEKWRGYYIATRISLDDTETITRMSLEGKNKTKSK